MIKTGLPYKQELMEEIANNSAIVKMNELNFPFNNTIATAIIYLRNTGFNVALDFSKCTYKEKEEYLLRYITEPILLNHKEFATTLVNLMLCYLNINDIDTNNSILSEKELDTFVSSHKDIMEELTSLIKSLPLFAMLNTKGITVNVDSLPHKEFSLSKNYLNMFDYYDMTLLFEDNESSLVYYTNEFTSDNIELLNKFSHSSLLIPFMYNMSMSDPREFEKQFGGLL